MTDHTNNTGDGLQKRPPTIGGLMWIVFFVAVYLYLARLDFASLPTILAAVVHRSLDHFSSFPQTKPL